jgi:hypothetical protein
MLAIALLGLLAIQEPDVDALLKQLSDESIEVREQAAAALVELGPKAEAKVRAKAATADGAVRTVCERILEVIAIPKELRKVVPPMKKITIDAKARKIKEVFDNFQNQSGLTLVTEGIGDGDVTVQFKDAAPLEALGLICKAAGMTYYLDGAGRYSRGMVAAAGPAGPSQSTSPRSDDRGTFPTSRGTSPTLRRASPQPDPFDQSRAYPTGISSCGSSGCRGWSPSTGLGRCRSRRQGTLLLPPKNPEFEGGRRPSTSLESRWRQTQSDMRPATYPESDAHIASIKGTASLKYIVGRRPWPSRNSREAHFRQTLELQD